MKKLYLVIIMTYLITIETNNYYTDEYRNFTWNKFNQKIDLSNNKNLTHLTLGRYEFNQEIDLSNNINLTHLTLGNRFNFRNKFIK